MSTEIDELEKRVAILEERISAPRCIAGHDPTGDGSAYQPEPAPGSDAEHPPVGHVLVPSASDDRIKADWLVWAWDRGPWESFPSDGIGYARNRSRCAVCRPIPANEGDLRLAESVAIPVGWKAVPEGIHREIPVKIRRRIASGAGLGLLIYPDPSIPWGEGYEAILPSEADIICDEYKPYPGCKSWEKWASIKGQARDKFAWRRRIPATTPTEPARDLSAEVERLEAELRAMTERAENFGRALRSIAEYKGLYIDSEAFYATRKIARVAIANEGEKA